MFAGLADEVIFTRVGFSTYEKSNLYKEYYNKVYPLIFKEIEQAYRDAGYGQSYRTSMFGGKKKLELPYGEIAAQAHQIADEMVKKAVKEQDIELQRIEKESQEQQKWQHIQTTRGRSSGILAPKEGVTLGKKAQYLVSKPRGETVIKKL